MDQKIVLQQQASEEMIEAFTFKTTSHQPIESIASKVAQACSDNQFALLHTYIYHEIVASKGFPIQRQVYIYEICRAKTAATMLTNYPHFSVFMPCKLAVYEENEQTVLATMNMEMMLNAIQTDAALYGETLSLFNTLKQMMETLSNT